LLAVFAAPVMVKELMSSSEGGYRRRRNFFVILSVAKNLPATL
jgi:hypothetical protein